MFLVIEHQTDPLYRTDNLSILKKLSDGSDFLTDADELSVILAERRRWMK